jgi:hypothetical protein
VSEYTIGWLKWQGKRFFPKKKRGGGWKCNLHLVQGFSSFGQSVCGENTKTNSTAIDNVFIDSSRKEHIYIELVINGLSYHDAQFLVIKNIESISNYHNYRK